MTDNESSNTIKNQSKPNNSNHSIKPKTESDLNINISTESFKNIKKIKPKEIKTKQGK